MIYFLQAFFSPPVLITLGVILVPYIAAVVFDRRMARTRQISGLPPAKFKAKTALALCWLLAFLGFIALEVFPSLFQMQARDKLFAANNAAKQVYNRAAEYAEDAENCGWEAPVTYIGEFDTAADDLSAYLHEQLGDVYPGKWYAVVFEDGKVQFALFSDGAITPEMLYKPDYDTELKKLLPLHRTPGDAVGYYGQDGINAPVAE